ncbi:hypothetical protein [Marinobacter sp. ELB17]|nr:NADH dehydrogenase subunit A [Marinobacter sp. ELB17]
MSSNSFNTRDTLKVDDATYTIFYLRLTGRPEHQILLVEAYAKEQGL